MASNVVELVSVEKSKRGKGDYVEINYKHLTGNFAGQVWKIGNFAGGLTDSSRELLAKSKTGDKVSIVTEKEGNFWKLKSVEAVGSQDVTKKTTSSGQASSFKSSNGSFDQTGIKVGAARNQAIAFLAATKGTKFTLDDIDTVAYEIVKRQQTQEEHVRAGTHPEQGSPIRHDVDLEAVDVDIDF